MGESVIEVVDVLQWSACRILHRLKCARIARIVLAEFHQASRLVAVLASGFRMTGLTAHVDRSEPHAVAMRASEVRRAMLGWNERCKILMTGFALIGDLPVVVACVAGLHRRHVLLFRVLHIFQTYVAGFAFEF